jgi:hypothetical protein
MDISLKIDGWRLYINDSQIPYDLRTMTKEAAIQDYLENGGDDECEADVVFCDNMLRSLR